MEAANRSILAWKKFCFHSSRAFGLAGTDDVLDEEFSKGNRTGEGCAGAATAVAFFLKMLRGLKGAMMDAVLRSMR